MTDDTLFRVGTHSKLMVWHDPHWTPDGPKTGSPVAMATTPEWAQRIADALNAAEADTLTSTDSEDSTG